MPEENSSDKDATIDLSDPAHKQHSESAGSGAVQDSGSGDARPAPRTEAATGDPQQRSPSRSRRAGQPAEVSDDRAEYQRLRESLRNLVATKKELDTKLEEVEEKIFIEEGSYLTKATAGNIIKGFDQYTRTNQNRRKSVFTDADRLFSQSSTSFDAEM